MSEITKRRCSSSKLKLFDDGSSLCSSRRTTWRTRNALNALSFIRCNFLQRNDAAQRQFGNLILIDDRQSLPSILIIQYTKSNQVTNGRSIIKWLFPFPVEIRDFVRFTRTKSFPARFENRLTNVPIHIGKSPISRTTKRRVMNAHYQVDRPTNVEWFNASHMNVHANSLNLQVESSCNCQLETRRQASRSICPRMKTIRNYPVFSRTIYRQRRNKH